MIPSFARVPIDDIGEPLVDLSRYGFVLDPQYFTQGLTAEHRMFLREGVADKLLAVQERFRIYRFKLWDGWRPRAVQKKLFDRFWNELKSKHPDWDNERLENEVTQFVNLGDERIIPPHATGGTVDLTLVDSNGNEVDMGTEFDYFGPEAAALYFTQEGKNKTIRENRKLFRDAMQEENFLVHPNEWWHFEYGTQSWALAQGKPSAFYGLVVL